MPDITMCNNADCLKKENCWRYMAEPSPFYQSFFEYPARDCVQKDYLEYWPVENGWEEGNAEGSL